jgi:hypothetical protein
MGINLSKCAKLVFMSESCGAAFIEIYLEQLH